MIRRTHVSIQAEKFFLNGAPTYADRIWNGLMVEGLLFGARPDPLLLEDVASLIHAMQLWRRHGVLALRLNMQEPLGGIRGATPDGTLLPPYLAALEQVLDEADWLRMVVMLSPLSGRAKGILRGPGAMRRALEGALDWLTARKFRNVLVVMEAPPHMPSERRDAPAEEPEGAAHWLTLARNHPGQFLVGCDLPAGYQSTWNVIGSAHFLLANGLGHASADQMTQLVAELRGTPEYRHMPVLVHAANPTQEQIVAALMEYAGCTCDLAHARTGAPHPFLEMVRTATGV